MSFLTNIEKATLENENFRKVLYTASQMQLVLMTLKPGEEIGEETHEENDQFFRFEAGEGKAVLNGVEHTFKADDVLIVPKGTLHNIINTSQTEPLKLYTIYAPPHHRDGVIHETKEQALTDDEEFDGRITPS